MAVDASSESPFEACQRCSAAICTEPARAAFIVRTGLNLAWLFARLAAPFIPFAAETVAGALGEAWPPAWPGDDIAAELARLPAGRSITTPPVLFRKIEDAEVAEWTERFRGQD